MNELKKKDGSATPLVTFVLFSYNQEKYIREAVINALAQTYSPLQIVLSDDCSTDTTYDIIRTVAENYRGPHQIITNRNIANLGLAEHINKLMPLALGELIVVAAGDDISLPERTAVIVEAFIKNKKKCNYIYSMARVIRKDIVTSEIISSPGSKNADNLLLATLQLQPLAIGATQAWTKTLINSFPLLNSNVWAEDQVFGLRGMLLGSVLCIQQPLVLYRIDSGISNKDKKNFLKEKKENYFIYKQRIKDILSQRKYCYALFVMAAFVPYKVISKFQKLLKK